jgi:6-phosphogluconolactonase
MTDVTAGQPEVVVVPDIDALGEEAGRRFVELASKAIGAGGLFRVALSGGSTPRALYRALSGAPLKNEVDWEKCQIFFSDERFVPPDSAESNYHTAREGLLSNVPIPERFVHPVATVDISPEQTATLYEQGIRRVFEVGESEVPRFDLVFLGMGPDGHTASLFPDTEALGERDRLVAPNFVPKLDAWRITFTYPLINAAATVVFLVQGPDKAERVAEVLGGDSSLPASGIKPAAGELVWLLDAAAAAKFQSSGAAAP